MIAVFAILPFRRGFIVPEGYAGLLYHNGKFVEVLAPGRHVRWGRNFTIHAQDTRKATLTVPTQEILTADNVSLKFSVMVTYQVADPVKAVHETQSWQADLYNAAQLALRTVASGLAVEPCHRLRKEFGSYVATSFGLFAAQRLLGHSSPDVTDAYYAGLTNIPELNHAKVPAPNPA